MALERKTLTRPLEPELPPPELLGRRKRPELGQYRLEVDRQIKSSYSTYDAAAAAGLVIKKGHPILQVAVYDAIGSVNTLIELPND